MVLLAQHKRSKADPNFSEERFQVIARDGAKVVLVSPNGIQYSRSVNDVKKAAMSCSASTLHKSSSNQQVQIQNADGLLELPVMDNFNDASSVYDSNSRRKEDTGGRFLRRRNDLQRPVRFDENFVYHIFG